MWFGLSNSEEEPLARGHVTLASEIMIPTYAVFFTVLGFSYIFTPHEDVIRSPGLRYVDHLMPLYVWGIIFLIYGIAFVVAIATSNRFLCRYVLAVAAVTEAAWMVIIIIAVAKGVVTFGAWAYPGLIVAACVASTRSLVKGER